MKVQKVWVAMTWYYWQPGENFRTQVDVFTTKALAEEGKIEQTLDLKEDGYTPEDGCVFEREVRTVIKPSVAERLKALRERREPGPIREVELSEGLK